MVSLLLGKGQFDFRMHRGRIYHDQISELIPEVPVEGTQFDCLAIVVRDNRDMYDFGYGVAAGVIFNGEVTIPAGWFPKDQAREYRQSFEEFGLPPTERMLCLGRLSGGKEMQFRKGPQRMPYNLTLDLAWPIRFSSEWYPSCSRFLSRERS